MWRICSCCYPLPGEQKYRVQYTIAHRPTLSISPFFFSRGRVIRTGALLHGVWN